MERVDVYRGIQSTDSDGNPMHGPPSLWKTFQALVGPAMGEAKISETVTMPVTIGYTVYIRGEEPTGILNTDVLALRGERLPVTAPPAEWLDDTGQHVGDEVTVRFTKGA